MELRYPQTHSPSIPIPFSSRFLFISLMKNRVLAASLRLRQVTAISERGQKRLPKISLVGLSFLFILFTQSVDSQTINGTTYPLTISAGALLEDMSSGTTQLVGPDSDDGASALFNIGFDYWFVGVKHSQFSANANGLVRLGTAISGTAFTNSLTSTTNVPEIATYWDDLWTGTNGKVHYKTIGSAPNRKLVVEWLNMQIPRVSGGLPGAGIFQLWLHESIGKIELVFGNGIAANSANSGYSVGFNTSASLLASISTLAGTVSYVTANNAQSDAITSGTKYAFTPLIPIAPTGLNFTAIGTGGMTLNWTDNASDEVGYVIYRSIDGVNYNFINQIAGGPGTGTTITSPQSGLNGSTLYYWKIYAVSEGAFSASLDGSQSTTACMLSGTYDVGPGAVSGYLTLKAAADAAALNGVTGPVIFELNAAYSNTTDLTFPILLGPVPCASSTNTITIRPSTGAGTKMITSASTTATLDINAGNYWIIDGRQGGIGGTKDLTIDNSSTTGIALRYINEASNNVVKYSTISGVNTSITSGVVVFSTTSGLNGNDNNTIENCDIKDGITTPANGIYSLGSTTTAAQSNSGNIISNNNIFNFFISTNVATGVLASTGSTDWTVNSNSFFQTVSRALTLATTGFIGININNTSGNNFTINNNFIGGSSASAGGTAWTQTGAFSHTFIGIRLSVGATTASNVQGNTIKNLSITTSTASTINAGIAAITGSINVGNTSPNTIGDQSSTGNILWTNAGSAAQLTGILAGTGTPGVINISNNTIGGISIAGAGTTIFRGINIQGAATSYTVNGNTVGSSSTANSISSSVNSTVSGILSSSSSSSVTISNNNVANLSTTGTSIGNQLLGISSSSGVNSIAGNTVRNLSSTSTIVSTGVSASIIGISQTSTTAGQTISQNTVHTLSNTTGSAAVSAIGIHYTGATTGTNLIASNLVHSINIATSSATGTILGINLAGGSSTYQNNMVRLGIDAAGNSLTNNIIISGIDKNTAANNNIYFNSVYIGGSGVLASTAHTFAFRRVSTGTDNLQNNIFQNARSNAAGTAKHYATGLNAVTTLTINYNDYFVSGTGGIVGYVGTPGTSDYATFVLFQAATLQDINSLNVDPLFIAPAAATPDLHITGGPTALESSSLTIAGITNDFDNNVRPGAPSGSNTGLSPDIGADEFDGINPNVCSGTPALGGTPIPSSSTTCNGSNITFTLSGATGGPGISYQWQTSPVGAGTWTNVPGATSTIAAFAISGNLDVRCLVTCIPSGLNTPSTIVTVSGVTCQFDVTRSTGLSYSTVFPGGTNFTWNTAASTPAVNGSWLTDENYTNAVTFPFPFTYRGSSITQFRAHVNGFVTLSNTALTTASAFSDNLNGTTNWHKVVAVFWEDIVTSGNSNVVGDLNNFIRYDITGVTPNRVLTVEWKNMETFSNAGPDLSFQIKFYETTNVIEYIYGKVQGFDGTQNFSYTYYVGNNAETVPVTPTVNDVQQQIIANTRSFSSTSTGLVALPECFSNLTFTPNTYTPYSPPGSLIPVNDEAAAAITLTSNPAPCTELCGTYYSSKNATASSTTVCGGTADDDVWFKFIPSVPDAVITVRSSGGYDAHVQLLNAALSNVTCQNSTSAGLTEVINATGLTTNVIYYIRVYHTGTGSGTTGEFSLCVNDVVLPPQNDNPCTAFPLTINLTCLPYQDNNLPSRTAIIGATTTTSNGVVTPTCSGAGTVKDVWFTAVAPASGTANFDIIPVPVMNPAVQLYSITSGTCGSSDLILNPVGCINGAGSGAAEQAIATGLTPGSTYYIRVYHHPSGPGGTPVNNSQFSICVYTPVPACPATFTPANSASVCSSTTTLSWSAAVNATSYDVYFDAGAGPAVTLVSPGQLGLTYDAGVLSVGQYSWRIEAKNPNGTTVCSNLTFTVSPGPTVNILPVGPINICAPATQILSLDMTNASSPTYQWKNNGIDISGETGTSYIASTSGSYSLMVTDGVTTCSSLSSDVSVTVNPQPTLPAITPSSVSLCSNETQLLTASGSVYSQTLLNENFEGGFGIFTLVNDVSHAGGTTTQWTNVTSTYTNTQGSAISSGSPGNKFAVADSDNYGSEVTTNTNLQTGAINASGFTTLTLNFRQYYNDFGLTDVATILVSTDGGTVWIPVQTYTTDQGTNTNFANSSVNLNAYAGLADLRIRFNYSTIEWDYFWAIDDVNLSGSTSSAYVWTPNGPGNGLYNDMAATIIYTGTPATSVYAKPTSTTTYTVTASGGGCSNTNTVQVFVNTLEVQNNNNNGGGSLRSVIGCAAPGSTITFAPGLMTQTINLTGGEIEINKNLTISGLGMLNLTLSGNNANRIFHLKPGNSLKIENLALKNTSTVTNGGAMLIEGALILQNALLQNNLEGGVPKAWTLLSPGTVDIQGNVDVKN